MTTPIQTIFTLDVKEITGANPDASLCGQLRFDLVVTMSRPFMFRAYPVFVCIAIMLISTVQVV
jgi:hypothetical protein